MKKLIVAIAIAALSATSAFCANVNTDDAATIQADLKGIGEKKAALIVAERENGAFVDGADLAKRVKGIGPKTVEKNADMLEFDAAPAAK